MPPTVDEAAEDALRVAVVLDLKWAMLSDKDRYDELKVIITLLAQGLAER